MNAAVSKAAAEATSLDLADARAALIPGETLSWGNGVPQLAYFRQGGADKPMIVFLPGCAHLARVAYGHPGSRPQEFLDHWLEKQAFSLLALSYPIGHPVFPSPYPELTIKNWATSSVDIIRKHLRGFERPPSIVVVAWSMAGRSVNAFNVAATQAGIDVECFLSFAATPPIVGTGAFDPRGESLNHDLLWDIGAPSYGSRLTRLERFQAMLSRQNRLAGHVGLAPDDLAAFYLGHTPVNLLGQSTRLRNGGIETDPAAALADLRTFSFADFPIVGCVIPSDQTDARHVLTDQASWAFFNSQSVFHRLIEPFLKSQGETDEARWAELRRLLADLPRLTCRTVAGNHYFFVGEPGAKTSAVLICDLVEEITSIRRKLAEILQIQSIK